MLWMNRDRSTQLLFKKSALSVVLNAEMTAQDLSLLSLVFPSFLPHPPPPPGCGSLLLVGELPELRALASFLP